MVDFSGVVYLAVLGWLVMMGAIFIGIPYLAYYLWTHLHWVAS